MIDISQWLMGLGVVSLGTHPINSQYDFYRNVEWSDGTFTHNQKEFFDKIGQSRYEHFKQYVNEREFYRNTNVPIIRDYYTFYKYAQQYIEFYDYLLQQYPGAAAAYSLTKLDLNYTGDAIQVRRDSDNAILDIGFDGNLLDTTALTNFCNTPVNIYTSDFANSEQFSEFSGTGYFNQSIGGRTGVYKFENDATTSVHQFIVSFLQEDTNVTVSFDYYIPSTNTDVNSIKLVNGVNLDELYGFDQWISYSLTFDAQDIRFRFRTAINGSDVNILAPNDVVYIDNLTFTQNTSNGYVPIWYDQSSLGNDAIQNTASEQPKIFDGVNGVVEINGKPSIDFSGTAHLQTVDTGIDVLIEQIQIVAYINTQITTTSPIQQLLNTYGSAGFEGLAFGGVTGSLTNETFTILNDGSAREAITDVINIGQYLFTIDWNGNSHNIYLDSNTGSYISTATPVQLNSRQLTIGRRLTGTSFDFGGQIQELILYASDQSSNRVAIEDNINNRYSIYP